MQRSYMEDRSMVGQLKIETKIYQTTEGLIILFIKLQFFHKVQQAFKSLRTSNSNLNLNLSFNTIVSLFVSFPIRLFPHSRPSLY